MAAVEDMAQLRGAGRAFAHQGFEPGALLAAVNDFSAAVIRGDFATSGVAVYHGPARALSYSSAGHPPALVAPPREDDVCLVVVRFGEGA